MSNPRHIVLTSHSRPGSNYFSPIHWGAEDARSRGPIIGSVSNAMHRNVIGAHSGSYSVYRAVSVAVGRLDPAHVPDLTNTSPVTKIGPHPQWSDPQKIVSFDPWGHVVIDEFAEQISEGFDIRPSIAITQAQLQLMELKDAIQKGRLVPDNKILLENGDVKVTKIAIDPVWYIPEIARRFDVDEHAFRRVLFEQMGGMYPELVTRSDLEVFLPPIGGITAYIFGDPKPSMIQRCRSPAASMMNVMARMFSVLISAHADRILRTVLRCVSRWRNRAAMALLSIIAKKAGRWVR